MWKKCTWGPAAFWSGARNGAFLIDMTTSEPALAVRIAAAAGDKGLHALDAPVSGGDVGAKNGTLAIMVGGAGGGFAAVRPLFEIMGENIHRQGGPGAGQHTKMCNQIVVAGNMLAAAEGLTYAMKSGLDPEEVLKSIGSGAASSFLLNGLGPKMIAGDFAPGSMSTTSSRTCPSRSRRAEAMGLDLPALKTAKSLYDKLAAAGAREDGTQALIKAYG